jgi:hypothetical protein
VDEFGTTAEERAAGEPLDQRLAREQPDESPDSAPDESDPAGRLVAPDEGAHPDTEADAIADDVGPDAGGYTAEEAAMRVDPEY